MKIEIISKEKIRPSFPTPLHLKSYKLSLLDQLAPPIYVPIILFYSVDECHTNVDHSTIYHKLKKSLAETLTRFYPLAGRTNGDVSVDLYDEEAVVFVKAHVNIRLSEIVENPETEFTRQLLPLDPYKLSSTPDDKSVPVTAVQLNVFKCGGMGIGVCVSHKVADGATLASFLGAWAAASRDNNIAGESMITPCLNSATMFPPREIRVLMPANLIKKKEKTVTKRFVFDATSLAKLKAEAAGNGLCTVDNPSRVEAVTALICRSATKSRRGKSVQRRSSSMAISHVVNLRGRTVPPLPEHAFGNIWRSAIAPISEEEEDESNVELHDLVGQLRKAIRKIDGDYVRKLQAEDGFHQAYESLKEVSDLTSKGEVEFYRFSSWVRFPFYETDFGWGKPIWTCVTNVPINNVVILMSTRSGSGIEAWVAMDEQDMAKFENDDQLLQFAAPIASCN